MDQATASGVCFEDGVGVGSCNRILDGAGDGISGVGDVSGNGNLDGGGNGSGNGTHFL
jgi:hypothetical protein